MKKITSCPNRDFQSILKVLFQPQFWSAFVAYISIFWKAQFFKVVFPFFSVFTQFFSCLFKVRPAKRKFQCSIIWRTCEKLNENWKILLKTVKNWRKAALQILWKCMQLVTPWAHIFPCAGKWQNEMAWRKFFAEVQTLWNYKAVTICLVLPLRRIQQPSFTKRLKIGGCCHVFDEECTVWYRWQQNQKPTKLKHETRNRSVSFLASIKLKTEWLEMPYS